MKDSIYFKRDGTKYRKNGKKYDFGENQNIFDYFLEPFIIKISYFLHNFFDSIIIPDILTTTSLYFKIISIFFLIYDNKQTNFKRFYASLFFIFGYIFDCIDGFYARKYNKCTLFGCFFDHFSDLIMFVILNITFYFKKMYYSIIISLILVLFFINEILIEQEMFNNYTPYFNFIKNNLNFLKIFKNSNFVKYFGGSSWIAILSLLIFLDQNKLKY